MTGGTSVTLDRPNPAGEGSWFSNISWAGFLQLSRELKVFEGFDKDMEKNIKFWEEMYASANPQSDDFVWPGKWNDLSVLHKTIVMRLLRPDKVIMMLQKLISEEEEMGQYYIIPPSFDMAEIVSDSINNTPIIIVLSAGADPMVDIMEVKTKLKQEMNALSLGRGQGGIAVEAIKQA